VEEEELKEPELWEAMIKSQGDRENDVVRSRNFV